MLKIARSLLKILTTINLILQLLSLLHNLNSLPLKHHNHTHQPRKIHSYHVSYRYHPVVFLSTSTPPSNKTELNTKFEKFNN